MRQTSLSLSVFRSTSSLFCGTFSKQLERVTFTQYLSVTRTYKFHTGILRRTLSSRVSKFTTPHTAVLPALEHCPPVQQQHHQLNMSDQVDLSQYTLPVDTGICQLECKVAFEALTHKEKLYSHYLSRASWYGGLICLYQCSPESPGIFILLQQLFRSQPVLELQSLATSKLGFTEIEFKQFLVYAAGFYGNVGNYKSFGDTKFIPAVSQKKVEKLIMKSKAFKSNPKGIQDLWDDVKNRMYSLPDRQRQLGLGQEGITTYFSDNCDAKDAELAQEFLDQKNLSPYNTRLFKTVDSASGKVAYEVRLASAVITDSGEGDLKVLGKHEFVSKKGGDPVDFVVTRGDYAPLMDRLVKNLEKAKEHAANDNETRMLAEYITCFSQGSIEAHKNGSRHWIKNQGPIVETYIGFIESYRDPSGVRGEFEGFVAMVNKEMSAKFKTLVDRAEHLLPLLPWPAAYEKDTFLKPDFTSLDVLTFGSSGVPAGINIPNYDDIRQTEGFKNVSLGNVLASGYKDTKITFLEEQDKELYAKLKAPSFEVQVGLHELLGHGSGKLFQKKEDGSLNFDIVHVKHTETKKPITSWYEAKETWDGKFGDISSSYEECRAECVGIYLCLASEILEIFGHTGQAADDIIYINWLNMVRAGLAALEFYTPETSKWRQAHMQARYVILKVLLEAGEDFVTIHKVAGEDGHPDLVIKMDRSKINKIGKKAIGDFLRKLQTYKATADYAAAKEMYDGYSVVCDREEPHFLSLRDIVLKRKLPRRIFVQCNTTIQDTHVELQEYENTFEGVINSFVDRFSADIEADLHRLWKADKQYFPDSDLTTSL